MSVKWVIVICTLHLLEAVCINTSWMGVLSCYGWNITEFPTFNRSIRHSVQHMDIINTSLTQFPDLTDWPNLFSLDIRDNAYIDCAQVLDFQTSFPQLFVLTDCDDHVAQQSKECFQNNSSPQGLKSLFSLIILPFLAISLGIYFKSKHNRVYKGVKTGFSLSSIRASVV
jgi:hypothetical protein